MAEEIKKVLEIEFKGQKTIGDVKKEIAQLKKELDACAAGSDEARKKSLELAKAENTLKAATKGVIDETGQLSNSYNGLVAQMDRLKIAQKNIDLSTAAGKKQFEAYAKKIKAINDQLKKLDASNGVFGRNVGNYVSAMSAMNGQFGGIVSGINSVRTALTALKAAGGWIGTIVVILGGIIAAIKSNEQAVERLKLAVSPFVGVFNQLITLAQKLGDILSKGIAKVLEGVVALTESFLRLIGAEDTLDKMKEAQEIEKDTQINESIRLMYLKHQAELYAQLLKLQSDFKKYQKDEQKAAQIALQAENKRLAIARENYIIAKNEYDLIVKKNAQTQSDKKDLEAEANALKQVAEAQAALTVSGEEWTKVIRKGNYEIGKEMVMTQIKDLVQARKALLAELDNLEKYQIKSPDKSAYDRSIQDLKVQIESLDIVLGALKTEYETLYGLSKEEAEKKRKEAQEEAEKMRQDLIKEVKSKSETLQDYILSYFDFGVDRVEKLTTAQLKEIIAHWDEVLLEDSRRLSEKLLNDINKKDVTIPVKIEIEEPEDEDTAFIAKADALRKRVEATVAAYSYETKTIKEQYEQQQRDLEIALNTKQITQEQFNNAMANLDKEYLEAKRALMFQEIDVYAEMADSIGSILGSVADMWEENLKRQVETGQKSQEEAEKEFENVKALQIASAVVSTISGAIMAYTGAAGNAGINAIPLVGPGLAIALGAINAAAVTAAGIAQIAQIKNTHFGSSSVGGGGISGGNQTFQLPPVEQYTPEYTQNLTGASDTLDLNNTVRNAIENAKIKAYVVESDITNAQNRANKRNQEATW